MDGSAEKLGVSCKPVLLEGCKGVIQALGSDAGRAAHDDWCERGKNVLFAFGYGGWNVGQMVLGLPIAAEHPFAQSSIAAGEEFMYERIVG